MVFELGKGLNFASMDFVGSQFLEELGYEPDEPNTINL